MWRRIAKIYKNKRGEIKIHITPKKHGKKFLANKIFSQTLRPYGKVMGK